MNNNPVQRRIRTATETDPLLLLKQLIQPAYLKQPDNLEPFAEHIAHTPNKRTGKEWSDSYDKNAAYLGVMATVNLGIGEPTHIQSNYPIELSKPLVPGVWLIDFNAHCWDRPMNLVPEGLSWQYTPVVNYLIEQDHTSFTCKEGFYFEDGKRLMWRLYNYLKDWRERDKEAAKECYTHLFGLLAHKPDVMYPGAIWRPDWLSTIIAESNVRIHRQAIQAYNDTGVFPTAWKVDCLYYDQEVSWFNSRIGTGIGEWKHATKGD